LLFWHGLGEDGNGTTDLPKVLVNGPPKLIAADAWPASRPFVVLSPQNASGCPSGDSIKAFLTWAITSYSLDPNRLYLTGLSCGAIGSWNYLGGEAPTTPIAAAVLIAGDGHSAWDTQKCTLGRVAIWAFHGDADTTVSPTGTTYPMTNLMACPSPPRRDAEMTIYPGVGHDSWSRTYDLSAGHDVYAWMLTNHL
jgi:predicted peptidase